MDTKNGIIGVGDRVYCRWPNDFWYWGKVTKKFKKGKVLFDDGDCLENLPRNQIATESQIVEEREARRSKEEKLRIVEAFKKCPHNFEAFAQIWNKGKIPGHDDYLSELSLRSWCKEGVPPIIETTANGEKTSENDISHERTEEKLPYSRRSEEEKRRILEEFKSSPHSNPKEFTRAWNNKKGQTDYLCAQTFRNWLDKDEIRCEKKKTSENDISREETEEKRPYSRRSEEEKRRILEEFKSGPHCNPKEFTHAWNKKKGQPDNLCAATLRYWLDKDEIRCEKKNTSENDISREETEEKRPHLYRSKEEKWRILEEFKRGPHSNGSKFIRAWNEKKGETDYLGAQTFRKWLKNDEIRCEKKKTCENDISRE
eukprot:scaffold68951_cov48-Attheya_sp.AAC.1